MRDLAKRRAWYAAWRKQNPNRIKTYVKTFRERYPDHHRANKEKQYLKAAARIAVLKAAPCLDCGGRFPPECMDFDHVRGEKLLTGVQFYVTDVAKVAAEIAKCDLVCANCHRTRTKNRRRA